MTFTPRTALEFGFGLILVVAAVVIGLNIAGSGELTDLLLGVLSLVGYRGHGTCHLADATAGIRKLKLIGQ